MHRPPVAKLEAVSHAYGSEPILRDVSLAVQPGEILGILGISGAGKSTLLRILAGFMTPQSGRIWLGDRMVSGPDTPSVPPEQRGVGMMFQDYALFPYLSVEDNVGYGIHTASDRGARVQRLLDLVGMSHYASRFPDSLSGGQQQRVALARALAPQPSVLLLDEPFANLDGPMRHDIGLQVRQILRDKDIGAVLVTHDSREALALSDRLAVLGSQADAPGATVLQVGTPEQLYCQPVNRDVAQLTGPTTFLEGVGHGDTATTALGELPLSTSSHGAIWLVLRPSDLMLHGGEGSTHEVVDRSFHGGETWAQVEGPGGRLMCATPHDVHLGDRGVLKVRHPVAAVPREHPA